MNILLLFLSLLQITITTQSSHQFSSFLINSILSSKSSSLLDIIKHINFTSTQTSSSSSLIASKGESVCINKILFYINRLKDPSTQSVLDSTNPLVSLGFGINDLGQFDTCSRLDKDGLLSNKGKSIYFIVKSTVKLNTSLPFMSFTGICFPVECDNEDGYDIARRYVSNMTMGVYSSLGIIESERINYENSKITVFHYFFIGFIMVYMLLIVIVSLGFIPRLYNRLSLRRSLLFLTRKQEKSCWLTGLKAYIILFYILSYMVRHVFVLDMKNETEKEEVKNGFFYYFLQQADVLVSIIYMINSYESAYLVISKNDEFIDVFNRKYMIYYSNNASLASCYEEENEENEKKDEIERICLSLFSLKFFLGRTAFLYLKYAFLNFISIILLKFFLSVLINAPLSGYYQNIYVNQCINSNLHIFLNSIYIPVYNNSNCYLIFSNWTIYNDFFLGFITLFLCYFYTLSNKTKDSLTNPDDIYINHRKARLCLAFLLVFLPVSSIILKLFLGNQLFYYPLLRLEYPVLGFITSILHMSYGDYIKSCKINRFIVALMVILGVGLLFISLLLEYFLSFNFIFNSFKDILLCLSYFLIFFLILILPKGKSKSLNKNKKHTSFLLIISNFPFGLTIISQIFLIFIAYSMRILSFFSFFNMIIWYFNLISIGFISLFLILPCFVLPFFDYQLYEVDDKRQLVK